MDSSDGNGNLASLINASDGISVANYEYGPFGETIRLTGCLEKNNPLRFATKYLDDESSLLNFGYRFYNPSTGVWLNRDIIVENGGVNLYSYAYNQSISSVDINGMTINVPAPTPAQVVEWASTALIPYLVNWLYSDTITITRNEDVSCNTGSPYLLSEHTTKTSRRLTASIIDGSNPIWDYSQSTVVSYMIKRQYGCCKCQGWFTANTTSWVNEPKTETETDIPNPVNGQIQFPYPNYTLKVQAKQIVETWGKHRVCAEDGEVGKSYEWSTVKM